MLKSFKELLWDVTEDVYRKDNAISYSTASIFLKESPKCLLDKSKKDSDSLRFGSLVDCLLTEPEIVRDRFFISDIKNPSDQLVRICNHIKEHTTEVKFEDIEDNILTNAMNDENYCMTYSTKTRISYLIKGASEYFNKLMLAGDKTIIDQDSYKLANLCVESLKNNSFTYHYINDNPFDTDVENIYQGKLKTTLYVKGVNIPVRCMFDKIIISHTNKTIQPIDLKTTSKYESKFDSSVLDWNYYLQGTMYVDILKDIIQRDDYFKDFTILPFTFIVINRYNRSPVCFRLNISDEDELLLKEAGFLNYKDLIYDIYWHRAHNIYNYSREVYQANGMVNINIKRLLCNKQ